MRRVFAFLLLAFCAAAPPSPAQRRLRPFKELRQQIEAEADAAPQQRIRTLNQLAAIRTPQARRFLLGLFAKEKDAAVRNTVLRLLGYHENAVVAKLLAKQLFGAANEALRRTAAYGLTNQERAGLATLLRALRAKNLRVREAALVAMSSAARTRQNFAGALMKVAPDLDPDLQRRALAGLRGRSISPAFERFLVELLDSPNVLAQTEALRQLALAGYKGIKARALAKAADAKLLKTPAARGAVFFALCALADADTLPPLLELAMEDSSVIHSELLQIARLPKARDRLVRAVAGVVTGSERAVDRLVAVEIVSRFRTPAADRALVAALADRSTAVVLAAIGPVSKRKLRGALSQLRKLFAGDHPELRLEAMLALHAVMKRDPGWPKQLVAQLGSPKIGLRASAIDLLADLDYRAALPNVQALVTAPEWQVRSAVYGFLTKVRAKSSIPLLIVALEREDGRLAYESLRALIALTHRNYRKADFWKKWWAAAGAGFTLPDEPKTDAEVAGTGPARPAAVTYYDIPVVSKRTCFLLDISGSMASPAGTARYPKIEHAKTALIQVLKGSPPDLRFNLITFQTVTHAWATTLQPMDEANRLEAIAHTRSLHARGGTNIYDALRRAFEDMSVDTIYLLSDGAPSAGKIRNIDELADTVRRWNRDRRILIHTISFGWDSKLLQRLAAESGGRYVRFV